MNQETLEEFAKRIANDSKHSGIKLDYQDGIYYGIEIGAKYQAERMYSEDEVRKLLQTQRGNCYVAILTKNKDKELAEIANNAPEPSGYNGWVKQLENK
jgi:hypothetical protein